MLFLTAEAALVIAFTLPPPPISKSIKNFSKSAIALLGIILALNNYIKYFKIYIIILLIIIK
jgi:hypothetical protein